MPGRKQTKEDLQVGIKAASGFWARVARANVMAIGSPEVPFFVKVSCRGMAKTTKTEGIAALDLLQHAPSTLEAFKGSDWVRCPHTRRWTSGGALMRGPHVIKTWSATQATMEL